MSDIWQSGDPMTQPPRWSVTLAGLVLVTVAVGSLVVGLMAGWQRGEPRQGVGGVPAQANRNAVDAVPLEGPEVTLRDDSAPARPAVAETAKVETPEETAPAQRTGNSAPAEAEPAVQTPAATAETPRTPAEPAPAEAPPATAAEAPPSQTPTPSAATPF